VKTYVSRSLRAGDYASPWVTSSQALFEAMRENARRVRTDDERGHFRGQVSYGLASGSITSQQRDELYLAAGLTEEGGF